MNSGIYEIYNLITHKKYIGSTINLRVRKSNHFSRLKNGTHNNKHLQYSYNKYGAENFIFNVIEEVEIKQLEIAEQKWIDYYARSGQLYNKRYDATNNTGLCHKKETKKKIQIAKHGYPVIQIDLNGNILRKWEFANQAAKDLNINFGSISSSVNFRHLCHGTLFVKSESDIRNAVMYVKNQTLIRTEKLRKSTIKPLYQVDIESKKIIKKWQCARDVTRELGFNYRLISRCALGQRQTACGYKWEFAG